MSASARVLIVEDEVDLRQIMKEYLDHRGMRVVEAENCAEAKDLIGSAAPQLAILDYSLPDGNALELMDHLRVAIPELPIIIITAHGSIQLAVEAVKRGAKDFLAKPVDLSLLHASVDRSLHSLSKRKRSPGENRGATRVTRDPFVGRSAVINNLAFLAHKIKDAVSPILIQGETGTGKGVLAHWFHDQGSRAQQPFVDLNCGSFSRELLESELFGHEKGAFTGAIQTKTGLLEIGDRGTVFLDEIGDVDLSIQPKLLKVLEEKQFRRLGSVCDKKVNIRLIAATHQDLRKLVREQRFRSDLFFRINTIALTMPALRERPEDIPLLSQLFLASLAEDMGGEEIELASSALRALQSYSWPGNVRELHNVLERAVLLKEGSTVTEADLHFEVDEDTDQLQPTLKNLERRYIRSVLAMEGGRVGAAARRLGMARSSLYHKLKQYRAEEPKARSDAASDTVMTSGFITPDPGDEFD